ncbi:prolactin-7B1-like [Peromyscus californicus insignis]|uniref:prolactin-7B1-like n=1 Tax=Peromyscus californicus insignis TaxID=564181 RepID=UPI0022A7A4E5|nr:prolactin-7B1-like [Peromyscus californicus insignis]
MLLVSSLLLWENMASASMDTSVFSNGEVSLKDHFDDAIILSKTISELATEIRRLFSTNAFSSDMFLNITLGLLKDQEFMFKTLNSCHTFSLNTPETKEEARKISLEDFLKLILSILHAWNNPLHHLLEELSAMPGAPDDNLSRVEDIEVKHKELQESIMRIVSRVHPEMEGNEEYPVWSELASLQSVEEKSRFFALYKLSYCLRVDTDKVNTYLRLLRCVHVHGDICYNLED